MNCWMRPDIWKESEAWFAEVRTPVTRPVVGPLGAVPAWAVGEGWGGTAVAWINAGAGGAGGSLGEALAG